jgi:anti-anti-sigma factor
MLTSQESVAVETSMLPPDPLMAPSRLTADHRLEFRRAVLEALEQASLTGATAVEVDLSITIDIDASGLGVLVLLQKRARERSMSTRLLNTPRAVRQMLHITRLDSLFEFHRPPAR